MVFPKVDLITFWRKKHLLPKANSSCYEEGVPLVLVLESQAVVQKAWIRLFSLHCCLRPAGHHLASCPSHNSPSARFMAKSDLLCQFPLDSLFCSYSCRRLQKHRPGDLPSETSLFNMLTCEKDRNEGREQGLLPGSSTCFHTASHTFLPLHQGPPGPGASNYPAWPHLLELLWPHFPGRR